MCENLKSPPILIGGCHSQSRISKSEQTTGFFEDLFDHKLWSGNTWEICQPKIDILFDWFQFTIKGKTINEVLNDFGLSLHDVLLVNRGVNGYDMCYVYGEKIKFLVSSTDHQRNDDRKMGINVMFSGYACREFEKKWSWYWLIFYVYENGYRMNRIDAAWDVFNTDKYFTVAKVRNSVKRACASGKAKKTVETTERHLHNGVISGETMDIGKRSSETMISFYNKLQERKANNYIVDKDITSWYRCELRAKNKSADNLIKEIYNDPLNTSFILLGVLKNLVKFLPRKDKREQNVSRMRSVEWWASFLGVAEKKQLSQRAVQSTIQRKKDWLENSVEKTLAMVLLSNIDGMSGDELQQFIQRGIKKIGKADLTSINADRIGKGGSVLTQYDLNIVRQQVKYYTANDLPF